MVHVARNSIHETVAKENVRRLSHNDARQATRCVCVSFLSLSLSLSFSLSLARCKQAFRAKLPLKPGAEAIEKQHFVRDFLQNLELKKLKSSMLCETSLKI